MTAFLTRKVPLVATLLASSAAFAGLDMDSRVSQLESQMRQVRTETANGTYGAKTAPSRPEVEGSGVKISFDVIYWMPNVGGTEYGYTDDSNNPFTMPIRGNTYDIDYDWEWGFKVGLGYNFEHDAWDLYAQYTYFDPTDSSSVSGSYNSSVVALRGYAGIVGSDADFIYAKNAKSDSEINYNDLNVELGRGYFVSQHLSFRPHYGLRTTWFDLKQNTRYFGGDDNAGGVALGNNTVYVKDRSDFWGLGVHTGVNSKWHLGGGFSILGDVAFSLLYGRFKVTHNENYSANENYWMKLNASMHRFVPAAQLCLGLAYDAYVCKNKHHIGVSLAYESNYFWRINQMLKIDDSAVLKYERYSEDASFHGVTLDLMWCF